VWLLDAVRAGGDIDIIRKGVELPTNDLRLYNVAYLDELLLFCFGL